MTDFNDREKRYPLIPLRGKSLFPHTILNFDVNRPISRKAVETAVGDDSIVYVAAQKDLAADAPKPADVNTTGVLARIKQVMKMSSGGMKVSLEAFARVRVVEFFDENGYFSVTVQTAPYNDVEPSAELTAHRRVLEHAFGEYADFDKRISKEVVRSILKIETPNEFVDNVMSVVPFKSDLSQRVLDTDDAITRMEIACELIFSDLEFAALQNRITAKVREYMDKNQKEFFLREQIKAIHSELGDDASEIDKMRKRFEEGDYPEEVKAKALKEISRLDKINPSSPDYSILLNYLDWLEAVPFNKSTAENIDVAKAKEILDSDHFGLEKVKQRILEQIAVMKLTNRVKGPILCFVGPPGVGKTSVATSIARALGRKFVRMSLGGVKDEAEIRGHRRTYVGAMPGRIVYGMKSAGASDPVFLLDEIDKTSADINGDPASALLEVLDPEQNKTFRDRYLEVPLDLSKVMFITTANTLDSIPHPLLDRMEVIEIGGYTDEEKLEIAKRYLLPKQIEACGLNASAVEVTDGALKEIISCYTAEAGVRNLERQIGSVVRKVAVKFAEHPRSKKQTITEREVEALLGPERRIKNEALKSDEVGVCTGLAWTSVGGVTLTIEVTLMHGKGEITLTGKLGDVMKESAKAAISYIRANAKRYGIDESRFETTDIHVHVPEGATPKDGPSAGITMATAILSAFTERPVRADVAMTGEITLRGKVLAIGGLKEKSLAAYRSGVKKVIIPTANKKDLTEIPKEVKRKLKFILADDVSEVFDAALCAEAEK